MWCWRVYNMLLGYEKLDEGEVGTHHDCRLGKWVGSQVVTDSRIKDLFYKLEVPHAKLHELAKEAIRAFNQGDISGAERALNSMDLASEEVVNILNQIKKLY